MVVSRDLARAIRATDVADTLQEALDSWDELSPQLEQLYQKLNDGAVKDSTVFNPEQMTAPLPRAWQWLDGSAYPTHGMLMQRAFNLPPIETKLPLMYQGMSHQFLGPTEDVCFPSEADDIDFEGELGVITDEVPMSSTVAATLRRVRLLVQINDWSLRAIAPGEMKTGFGWIQAKPACSVAPVAVTPDEFGDAWSDGRLAARLEVRRNGVIFGDVPTHAMAFGFHELIAHAARTRSLCAGTIIGSGTVSTESYRELGSCCISERRAIEMIDSGKPETGFLKFQERIAMQVHIEKLPFAPFGTLDQRVVSRPTRIGSHGSPS